MLPRRQHTAFPPPGIAQPRGNHSKSENTDRDVQVALIAAHSAVPDPFVTTTSTQLKAGNPESSTAGQLVMQAEPMQNLGALTAPTLTVSPTPTLSAKIVFAPILPSFDCATVPTFIGGGVLSAGGLLGRFVQAEATVNAAERMMTEKISFAVSPNLLRCFILLF